MTRSSWRFTASSILIIVGLFALGVIAKCGIPPTVDAGPDQTLTCSQLSVTLSASVAGGTTPYTYEWTDSSGTVVGNTEDITVSSAGTYTLTVTGADGCSGSDSVTVTDDRGQVVNFPDPGLEAAIREAINKPTGDIYECDLEGLTALNANNRGISNLEGLQYCTRLVSLALGGNDIRDLSPLAGLVNLNSLYLGNSKINNIESLSSLTSLTRLDLDFNYITDISPLAGLVNLHQLNLRFNKINDIEPLSALTNLMILDLVHNYVTDISPLAGLVNLVDLHMWRNKLTDISPLAALTKLSVIDISINYIQDITSLSGLKQLRYLNLKANQIADIAPLVNNPGISNGDKIDLTYNNLDITCPDSSARQAIAELEARGAEIHWLSQNNSAPDSEPPTNPTITSSSHQVGGSSSDTQVVISISGAADNCSIDGYEYAWDQNDSWTPTNTKMVDSTWTGDTFTATADGNWYFHIATVDTSGNWSSQTTFGPIVISQCVPPTVNAGPNQTLTCSQLSVTLDASVAGGTTPYTYEWTDSLGTVVGNTEDITVSSAGTYTLTVTGANGCSESDSVIVTDERGQVVNFPDPGLEAAIREAINKPTGDIYECELRTLTSLDAHARNITDLSGLDKCSALQNLYLAQNHIVDLAELSNLAQLQQLDLEGNAVEKLDALSGLSNLKELLLADNPLEGISPLAMLKNLQKLELTQTGISNIDVLAGLVSLKQLWLYGDPINNFSVLANLTNLSLLNVGACNLTDISWLLANSGLGQGDKIYVYYNDLDIMCPDSSARRVISELESRGASVHWQPQNNSAPDSEPPTNPTVSSSSHQVGVVSPDTQVVISISGASDNCSVNGYEYAWDQNDSWTPTNTKMVDSTWTGDTFTATADGNWYFHIATVDTSGNWSSPVTFGPIVVNTPPVANAGSSLRVEETSLVTITGTATDADGDKIVSYRWTELDGPEVELLGDDTPEVAFYAPDLSCEDQDITLQLVVKDSAGLKSAPSKVTITVKAKDAPPSVKILSAPDSINEGDTVSLEAEASDTDGHITQVQWSGEGSFTDPGSKQTNWTAPLVSSPKDVVIVFSAVDDCGKRSSARITIHVYSVNQLPIVNPGGPYITTVCKPIILDASQSNDPDGTIESYKWDLDNDGVFETIGTSASFARSNPGQYTVKLKVTDNEGGIATTDISIKVTGVPISISMEPYQFLTCNQHVVTLQPTITGGEPPYIYVWTDSNSTVVGRTKDLTVSSPDTYTLKVIDTNGCIATSTVYLQEYKTISVTACEDKVLTANTPYATLSCEVLSAANSSASVASTPISGWWIAPNGTRIGNWSDEITVWTPGTYTVTVIQDGCEDTDSVEVTLDIHADVELVAPEDGATGIHYWDATFSWNLTGKDSAFVTPCLVLWKLEEQRDGTLRNGPPIYLMLNKGETSRTITDILQPDTTYKWAVYAFSLPNDHQEIYTDYPPSKCAYISTTRPRVFTTSKSARGVSSRQLEYTEVNANTADAYKLYYIFQNTSPDTTYSEFLIQNYVRARVHFVVDTMTEALLKAGKSILLEKIEAALVASRIASKMLSNWVLSNLYISYKLQISPLLKYNDFQELINMWNNVRDFAEWQDARLALAASIEDTPLDFRGRANIDGIPPLPYDKDLASIIVSATYQLWSSVPAMTKQNLLSPIEDEIKNNPETSVLPPDPLYNLHGDNLDSQPHWYLWALLYNRVPEVRALAKKFYADQDSAFNSFDSKYGGVFISDQAFDAYREAAEQFNSKIQNAIEASKAFIAKYTKKDYPPTATAVYPEPAVTVSSMTRLDFKVQASDLNGDLDKSLWYLDGQKQYTSKFHSRTTTTWSHTFIETGMHTVICEISDKKKAKSRVVWSILVTPSASNSLSTLSVRFTESEKKAYADEEVMLHIQATDENSILTDAELVVDGTSQAFIPLSGQHQELSWNYTFSKSHTRHLVTVTVRDAAGHKSSAMCWITVCAPMDDHYDPEPEEVAPLPKPGNDSVYVTIGEPVTFIAYARDWNGDLARVDWQFDKEIVYSQRLSGFEATVTWSYTFAKPHYNHHVRAIFYDTTGRFDWIEWNIHPMYIPVASGYPNTNQILSVDVDENAEFSVHATDEDENLDFVEWILDGTRISKDYFRNRGDEVLTTKIRLTTPGIHTVQAKIYDRDENTVAVSWLVSVGEKQSTSLTVTRISPKEKTKSVNLGETVLFGIEAKAEGTSLVNVVWYVDKAPVETHLISGSGLSDTFSYSFWAPGKYWVVALVKDATGERISQDWDIYVASEGG